MFFRALFKWKVSSSNRKSSKSHLWSTLQLRLWNYFPFLSTREWKILKKTGKILINTRQHKVGTKWHSYAGNMCSERITSFCMLTLDNPYWIKRHHGKEEIDVFSSPFRYFAWHTTFKRTNSPIWMFCFTAMHMFSAQWQQILFPNFSSQLHASLFLH